MSTAKPSPFREQVERRALDKIAERIISRFPDLAPEDVVAAIQGRYADYEQTRIREFLPVLAERSRSGGLAAR